jgi:hypothetical protein
MSFAAQDARTASSTAMRQAYSPVQAGTQVFGTGQTSAHFGVSKCPSHSVHFFGSMMNVPPFSEIAAFGHSNSQMLHPVH